MPEISKIPPLRREKFPVYLLLEIDGCLLGADAVEGNTSETVSVENDMVEASAIGSDTEEAEASPTATYTEVAMTATVDHAFRRIAGRISDCMADAVHAVWSTLARMESRVAEYEPVVKILPFSPDGICTYASAFLPVADAEAFADAIAHAVRSNGSNGDSQESTEDPTDERDPCRIDPQPFWDALGESLACLKQDMRSDHQILPAVLLLAEGSHEYVSSEALAGLRNSWYFRRSVKCAILTGNIVAQDTWEEICAFIGCAEAVLPLGKAECMADILKNCIQPRSIMGEILPDRPLPMPGPVSITVDEIEEKNPFFDPMCVGLMVPFPSPQDNGSDHSDDAYDSWDDDWAGWMDFDVPFSLIPPPPTSDSSEEAESDGQVSQGILPSLSDHADIRLAAPSAPHIPVQQEKGIPRQAIEDGLILDEDGQSADPIAKRLAASAHHVTPKKRRFPVFLLMEMTDDPRVSVRLWNTVAALTDALKRFRSDVLEPVLMVESFSASVESGYYFDPKRISPMILHQSLSVDFDAVMQRLITRWGEFFGTRTLSPCDPLGGHAVILLISQATVPYRSKNQLDILKKTPWFGDAAKGVVCLHEPDDELAPLLSVFTDGVESPIHYYADRDRCRIVPLIEALLCNARDDWC